MIVSQRLNAQEIRKTKWSQVTGRYKKEMKKTSSELLRQDGNKKQGWKPEMG
jgi:hypothetical protein